MTSYVRSAEDGGVAEGTTIAAILTGSAAVLTAWAAVRRAGSRGTEECEESLTKTREEAEAAAAEIHRMRMAHPEDYQPPIHHKEEDDAGG